MEPSNKYEYGYEMNSSDEEESIVLRQRRGKNIFNSTKTKQNKKLTKLPFSLRISLRFSRSDFRLRSLQYLILGAEGCKHAR
ncbi:hypothetical protein LWI29_012515 [Acer saccharum]|uniref:Uncharacterized protein n=1 Tax=Acer saccharum TaxID=4024 RepID=A0AA39VXM1_ACESA|nr:hypothetical protein LWI29_012515 [Acer saccharum]